MKNEVQSLRTFHAVVCEGGRGEIARRVRLYSLDVCIQRRSKGRTVRWMVRRRREVGGGSEEEIGKERDGTGTLISRISLTSSDNNRF